MRFIFITVCLIAVAGIGCLIDDTSGVGETVSTPDRPAGPDTLQFGQPGEYSSGGAVSSKDHAIEYRFDFDAGGDHEYSDWLQNPRTGHTWPDSGSFQVKAQARCIEHPGNRSRWSLPKQAAVIMGDVPVPETPAGPAVVWTNSLVTYCTAKVPDSDLHPVEYRFDFDAAGSHYYSPWMDTTCLDVMWDNPGGYEVKAQARRVSDTTAVSAWSPGLAVTVNEYTLPVIHFAVTTTLIGQGTSVTTTEPYIPGQTYTVGVCRPLTISYHGSSSCSPILRYQFFPLSFDFTLPGQLEWTTDLSDTSRVIDLCANQFYSGQFRLAAQCQDEMGGMSIVDAGRFEQGVCVVEVNFPPETEIFELVNTYFLNQVPHQRSIDFEDAVPDTIPYNSWVRLFYRGADSPYDSIFCQDPANQCITYQKAYRRYSARFPYAEARSANLPPDGEDNNPFGVTDSTSLNIGSVEYELYVRSLDEHGKPDPTPATVELVGNFDPVLDECDLTDHLDNHYGHGDTLSWNWWRPANADTFNENTLEFEKKFQFIVNAAGHDHPMEPTSGVKNWLYNFYDLQSVNVRFARSGAWVAGSELNSLSDTFAVTFSYPLTDPAGDQVFANLPNWLDVTYDLTVQGRDTGLGEEFSQYMFVNSNKELLNVYPVSMLGRWTEQRTVRFHLRLVR